MQLEGPLSSSREFFSTHRWSQKVASSWPGSRDAGLVGRLTVGDIRENNGGGEKRTGNEGNRWCTFHTNPHINTDEKAVGAAVRHITRPHYMFFLNTQTRFACKMYETSKNICKNIGAEYTAYFSTLSHVLEKERTAGPCRQSPFFSLPVVVGVWLGTWLCSLLEGGHCFAEFEAFEVSEAPVPVPH